MHFVGGIAMAYFFDQTIGYLDRLELMRVGSRAASLVMVLGLVATSAVIWEFVEFLADRFFDAGSQRGLVNVMRDQFFGLLGGIAYIGFLGRASSERHNQPLQPPRASKESYSARG